MIRRGFTLVELLVVIGIIGLLLGILLPTIARVTELARRTKCLSNLRQIATGMVMYANDAHDHLPNANPSGYYGPDDVNLVLVDFASHYLKSPALFWCPCDVQLPPKQIDSSEPDGPTSARISYEFFSLWWDSSDGPKLTRLKLAPLVWDCNGGDPQPSTSQNHGLEGGNVGYSDGHADWQPRKEWDGPNWPNPANQNYPYSSP